MYIVSRIQILLSDRFRLWDIRAFTELRDLVVSLLTLFNARRGWEPAGLFIRKWHDAANNSWLSHSRLDNMADNPDRELFHERKLHFKEGKEIITWFPYLFRLMLYKLWRHSMILKYGEWSMFGCQICMSFHPRINQTLT